MTLAARVMAGMILGVGFGLFWGELMAPLDMVGKIFIMLLQMTVLPYILTSVMLGVGSLKSHEVIPIAKYGGIALLFLWLTTIILLIQTRFALPERLMASFFNPALVQSDTAKLALDYFIPANPFSAMAQQSVPAVVLFSIAVGIAIIGMEKKARILESIEMARDVIVELSGIVIRFTPYGVFAITAAAAGTMSVDELKGIYIFIIMLTVMALFLTFWAFPRLIKDMTPFHYREVLSVSRDALITAFATGSLFVVLPIIAYNTKQLILSRSPARKSSVSIVDVVVPISYTLPTAGKMLGYLFIIFAGWFSGEELAAADYPTMILMGLSSFFSPMVVSIPELLDHFHIPPDLFKLYLLTDQIIFNRFYAIVSVMFSVGMALIVGAGAVHFLKINWLAVVRSMILTALIMAAIIAILSKTFAAIDYEYNGYAAFIHRDPLLTQVEHTTLTKVPRGEVQDPPPARRVNVLDRIKKRGFLRVGYFRDWLPYAFHNDEGVLVGLDIELFHQLAADLGVKIEFVRVYRSQAKPLLDNGYLDIASGVASMPNHLRKFTLSPSYVKEIMAMTVRHEDRRKFRSWSDIREMKDLIIGVPDGFVHSVDINRLLPNAKVWEISTPRMFYQGGEEMEKYDALLFGAAAASGWSLIFPNFSVVVPTPGHLVVPLAFPLAHGDTEFELYMRQWIEFRTIDGTIDRIYRYWIMGESNKPKAKRWSLWQTILDARKGSEKASDALDSKGKGDEIDDKEKPASSSSEKGAAKKNAEKNPEIPIDKKPMQAQQPA